MKMQVMPNDHYLHWRYSSKERFCSYWHQIDEIMALNAKNILEIGIGNRIVSDILKKMEMNVITLDINGELKPDCIGSVLHIPFRPKTFQVVAAFELMEHLPYAKFGEALRQIFEVSDHFVILSLPEAGRVFRFFLTLPFGIRIRLMIPVSKAKKSVDHICPEHFWEINVKGYPLSRIIADIGSVGFKIQKTYRVFERPYHRFIILRKVDK